MADQYLRVCQECFNHAKFILMKISRITFYILTFSFIQQVISGVNGPG